MDVCTFHLRNIGYLPANEFKSRQNQRLLYLDVKAFVRTGKPYRTKTYVKRNIRHRPDNGSGGEALQMLVRLKSLLSISKLSRFNGFLKEGQFPIYYGRSREQSTTALFVRNCQNCITIKNTGRTT